MTPEKAKTAEVSELKQTLVGLLSTIHRLVRFFCFLRGHKSAAQEMDDYCQNIVIHLAEDDYRRLRSLKEQSAQRTWLVALIRNYLLNTWQRQKEDESLDDIDQTNLVYQAVQEEEIAIKEHQGEVQAVLGRLDDRDHQLFDLTCQDLSDAEIAEQMNVEAEWVRKRRYVVIRKIQRLLREEGWL